MPDDLSDELVHRAKLIKRRRLALRVAPWIALAICLTLFLGLGALFLRGEHAKNAAVADKAAALSQIATLNDNREQLLAKLGSGTLSKAQVAQVIAQLQTVAGMTRTIALQGKPGVGRQGLAGLNGTNGRDGRDASPVPGPAGSPGAAGVPVPGPAGSPGAAGESKTGPPGSPGAEPASFSFTTTDGQTYDCTDPDGDGTYTCSDVTPSPSPSPSPAPSPTGLPP